MSRTPPPVACWWLRNDLRVHDNPCLARVAALVAGGQCASVLPVYFFDPRTFRVTPFGNLKTGAFRAQFLLESVLDLKDQLRRLNSDLLICIGKPEDLLPTLLPENSVVVTQEEVTSEELAVDRKVEKALKSRKGRLTKEWGATLYHKDDLPYSATLANVPEVFTPFKSAVEAKCRVRPQIPEPRPGSLPLPTGVAGLDFIPTFAALPFPHPVDPPVADPRTAFPFHGGESQALKRLKYYLFDSGLVSGYFETRNGMLGADYSTKLAPWLAAGCLSPRRIHHDLALYEKQRGATKSTYWVVFELIWRDFFRFFAVKHGNAIFLPDGPARQHRTWQRNPDLLQRWKEGRTGLPLVDANMRELNATGWMSNRGRQNVASYLALNLQLDWREGADYFESLLLDYDVCSNWGNWVAAAALTGGRINHFNIPKQSKDYDPKGDYARHWIPELSRVSSARIHEPHLMSAAEQKAAGVQIGIDYPSPPPARSLPLRDRHNDGPGRSSGPPPTPAENGARAAAIRSGGKGWGRPY